MSGPVIAQCVQIQPSSPFNLFSTPCCYLNQTCIFENGAIFMYAFSGSSPKPGKRRPFPALRSCWQQEASGRAPFSHLPCRHVQCVYVTSKDRNGQMQFFSKPEVGNVEIFSSSTNGFLNGRITNLLLLTRTEQLQSSRVYQTFSLP